MIRLLRADERYENRSSGILSRSCFASGANYDPANVAFAALVAVDEHLLEPGAGFPSHPHRGVDLVSVVLAGTLRHTDDAGRDVLVRAGAVQVQRAGGGVRHAETNASAAEPLRMVQMALLAPDDTVGHEVTQLPVRLPAGTLTAVSGAARLPAGNWHLHVLDGDFQVADHQLRPGDTVRGDEPLSLEGRGRALLWDFRSTRVASCGASGRARAATRV